MRMLYIACTKIEHAMVTTQCLGILVHGNGVDSRIRYNVQSRLPIYVSYR